MCTLLPPKVTTNHAAAGHQEGPPKQDAKEETSNWHPRKLEMQHTLYKTQNKILTNSSTKEHPF